MTMSGTLILGIDPGLQRTGWGVILSEGPRLTWVAHGVIAPDPKLELSSRLAVLANGIADLIALYRPAEAAVEETFMANNAKSALLLGHARGVALAGLALANLPVGEYAARRVKKALVGTGAAEKDQVAFMVRRLLPLAGTVSADAADALAVALCHAAERTAPGNVVARQVASSGYRG
jgi:crossover junction endodeoxyribonuclease RuvC